VVNLKLLKDFDDTLYWISALNIVGSFKVVPILIHYDPKWNFIIFIKSYSS
jgi:hypothetical protein